MPFYIWLEFLENPEDPSNDELEERKKELDQAWIRFLHNGVNIPPAWVNEVILFHSA